MTQLRDTETEREQRTAKYRNWDELLEQDGLYDPADPAQDAYVDLVQRDPVICDTCFSYRYDVTAVEWWRGSFGWLQYEKWDARRDANVERPADDTPAQGMRLACAECGCPTRIMHRPIPKRHVRGYTANLSDALAQKGIDHDPETLHRRVDELNTSENQCRQDSHVFTPAVADAIHAAQDTQTTPVVEVPADD